MKKEEIRVDVFSLSDNTNPQSWYDNKFCECMTSGYGDTTTMMTINGHSTYYYEQKASTNGAYIDENYVIAGGKKISYFIFVYIFY